MANYTIEEIEGIGPALGAKLRAAGIVSTNKLLAGTKTKSQRQKIADAAGIPEKQILKFANMADLFRVQGVGKGFAELLEAAGVDSVPELAQRKAENLTVKMAEVNKARNLTRRDPYLKEVEKRVAQAKNLPRALEY